MQPNSSSELIIRRVKFFPLKLLLYLSCWKKILYFRRHVRRLYYNENFRKKFTFFVGIRMQYAMRCTRFTRGRNQLYKYVSSFKRENTRQKIITK